MFLTPDQLRELTGKCRPSAQARVLKTLGIEHRTRPDGFVLVLVAHVEHLLNPGTKAKVKRPFVPNWKALAENPKA